MASRKKPRASKKRASNSNAGRKSVQKTSEESKGRNASARPKQFKTTTRRAIAPKSPAFLKRSRAAKKGWATRRRKQALALPSRDKRFLKARDKELRDIERRPYVKRVQPQNKQTNHVKNLFFRRMNRIGLEADEIWRIYYGR